MLENFGAEYIRAPREKDIKRILVINAGRGFTGCVGSRDYQNFSWRNCPVT